MINIGREVSRRAARKQRGVKLSAGARFIRGLTPISIQSVGQEIKFTDLVTGLPLSLSRQDFLGVAITRLPITGTPDTDLIAQAWDIAGARRISFSLRSAMLKQLAQTLTGDDKDMVLGWAKQLQANSEPKKTVSDKNA